MVHKIRDRVADTSTTTGTSDFTVSGTAQTGYETLNDVLSAADTFDYLISHQTLGEWEQGIGTYSGSHVFVRTTVKQSSNSDAAVNFSAGTKDVVIVHSADRIRNPRLASGEGIYDDAGNEQLLFNKTASAVNQFEITNAATGNPVTLEAKGGDTDIGALIKVKGAGLAKLGGTSGLASDSAGAVSQAVSINTGPLAGFHNRLFNGCMRINQRQSTSVADDAYCFDQWYVLSQTGSMTISQTTNIENGWAHSIKILQGNTDGSSNHRFGLAQIIESANCVDLRGAAVTFSAKVRQTQASGSAAATIRYAILEWTGTADAPVSDVVNDWTSGTYTAGNFFNSTTLNVLATGSLSVAHNTVTDLTPLTATVGSSANNLIVVVWTSATNAQNNYLEIGKVQLEIGATASLFERRPKSTELSLCQCYCEKSYSLETAPGSVTTAGASATFLVGLASGTYTMGLAVPFKVRKLKNPAITLYSPATGATAKVRDDQNSADVNGSSTYIGEAGFTWFATANSAAAGANLSVQWLALAEL